MARERTDGDGCAITLGDGRACPEPVESAAPVSLCTNHLLAAYDWVARDVGVTDLLPSPCLACGRRVGIRYPSGWICAACEWRVGELPDQGVVDERIDVVYYLRFGDRIKIGTSNNPRQRIAALPHHEVLAFELGGRMLEQRRHAQFAELRIPRTEWFETGPSLTAHVAALQEGVEDPWAQYASWRSRRIALSG